MTATVVEAYYQLIPSFDGAHKDISKKLIPEAEDAGEDAGEKAGSSFKTKMLGAIGALGLGALLAQGLNEGFEKQMATGRMAAALDLSAEQTEIAGQAAGELYSQGFGDSIDDVARATEAVLSSIGRDLDSDTLKGLTEDAMNLATVFDVDVAEAAQTANTLITNGLARDGQHAMDLLTTAMQQMPSHVRGEALPALTEYSKSFAALGIDGETAIGMLVSASDQGVIGVDKMGDAVKEFTIRATDMSSSTQEAFAAANGMDLSEMDQKSKEGADALQQLGMDTQRLSNDLLAGGDSAKAATAEIVNGLRDIDDPSKQAAAAIALFGSPLEDLGVDQIPAFLDSMAGVGVEMGDVSGASERMADKLGDQIAPMDLLKRSFMSTLSDALTPLLPVITAFTDWATENPAVMQGVVLVLGLVAAALTVASIAQWAMNSALLASPMTWIILGIMALIAGLVLLWQNWDSISAWLSESWGAVVEFGKAIWTGLGEFFSGLWDGIKDGISAAWEFIKTIISFHPLALIIDNWDSIKEWFSGLWDGIKDGVSVAWDWIKTIFSWTPLGFVITKWQSILDWFKNLPTKIGDFLSGIKDKILAPFKGAFNAVASAWNNTVGKLQWEVPSWVPGIGGNNVGAPQLPLLATGGTALSSGWSIVGEEGPEFLHMPKGASVVPLDHQASPTAGEGDLIINIAEMIVRNEGDIRRIAEELFRLEKRDRTGRGDPAWV